MDAFQLVENAPGVVFPQGFQAAGAACDIRQTGDTARLDLAVIYSELPCQSAGVFTRNAIFAAPVKACRELLRSGAPVHGIVANSGNANACTGAQGWSDAVRMVGEAAAALGLTTDSLYVASTGRIGRALPMDAVSKGIQSAVDGLSTTAEAGFAAADAILTSDTRRKVACAVIETPQGQVRVGGIAKGAGMIEPNMATMLAFITTDARVPTSLLQGALHDGVALTFNAITVDGDMSTNDTVLVLANGASGIAIDQNLLPAFKGALKAVCEQLARKIVGDGEKISKVVELRIVGAKNNEDAERVARAIGNSLLVKSSWYGNDPNWGRLLDAAGYSGAAIREEQLELFYRASPEVEAAPVFLRGNAVHENLAQWKEIVRRKEFLIELNLHLGEGSARLWSTDLTEAYVHFNKSE